MRRQVALILACTMLWLSAAGAASNNQFTATWEAPTRAVDRYEFRWTHFASTEWIALPDQAGTATTFTATFPALPNIPTTDRWMCLDGRGITNSVAGAWLSDTGAGAACAVVDVGASQSDRFRNLTNQHGVLSFDYRPSECKRGVSRSTGQLTNGSRTITLTCRQ